MIRPDKCEISGQAFHFRRGVPRLRFPSDATLLASCCSRAAHVERYLRRKVKKPGDTSRVLADLPSLRASAILTGSFFSPSRIIF